MGRFLLITLLLASFSLQAQTSLVGIKNGNWLFFQGDEEVMLPPSYYDVGIPDHMDLATFAKDGRYGLINTKGEIVLAPKYQKMKSFGYGKFGGVLPGQNHFIEVKADSIEVFPCRKWTDYEKNWVAIIEKSRSSLVNVVSGQKWIIDSTLRVIRHKFGHVQFADSNQTYLYGPMGDLVSTEGGYAAFQSNYLRIKSKEQDLVILSNSRFTLPEGVTIFQQIDGHLQYSRPGQTVQLDLLGKVIWDVPYDKVSIGDPKTYIVSKNNRFALMDLKGKLICPLNYINIFRSGKEYRIVTSSGIGAMDRKGKIIVPCKYRSVIRRGSMYEVETSSELIGVYSPKTKKMLLPPKFKRVAVSDDKIRGWLNDNLQIVMFDEDHVIIDKITLNNTVSKYSLATKTKGLDARLFSVGWFYEQKPIFNKEGFKVNDKLSWGIRNEQDSLILKPRFSTPLFVPGMNFNLIPQGEIELTWKGQNFTKVRAYAPIDITNGRFMTGDRIISVDSSDALTRSYMRFVSDKGRGYIASDNKVNYTTYIDVKNVRYVRIAESKTGEMNGAEPTHPEGVGLYEYNIGANGKTNIPWEYRNETFSKVIYPDARWNFLNEAGQKMFGQSFDFVENFHFGSAIVKQEGKWGLTTADSMVIAPRYSKVERVGVLGDTVLKVRLDRPGIRYMDTLTNDLPIKVKRIDKNTDAFSIVQSGLNMNVLDNDYKALVPEGKSFRLLKGGGFYERIKKDFIVYNNDGSVLLECSAKPNQLLLQQFIVYKSGSKFGLLDSYGDTLLEPQYKTIVSHGKYILAKGSEGEILMYNGAIKTEVEGAQILVDPITNHYAVTKGKNTRVYNSDNERVAKFSGLYPTFFLGKLIGRSGREVEYEVLSGERPIFPKKFDNLQQIENYGYLLDSASVINYYDQNWRLIDNGEGLERGKYLGEGVVRAKSDSGSVLVSPDTTVHFSRGTGFSRSFSDHTLLVNMGKKSWFIDTDLKPIFDRKFNDATEFKHGYASVNEAGGWTIIDKNGYQKSLNSYGKISVVGNNLFSTSKRPLYGLYSHSGALILEVEYERITFLENGTIQAVRDGNIFYFTGEGKPIAY